MANISISGSFYNSNEEVSFDYSLSDGEFNAFVELYPDDIGVYLDGYSNDDCNFDLNYNGFDPMSGYSLSYQESFKSEDRFTSWSNKIFDYRVQTEVYTSDRKI